ncbi:hypothetical protein EP7_005538 (plasmid) [Isosphaeraceae bacterium EP7]
MADKPVNFDALDFTDLADLVLFQHALRRGWPVSNEYRAKVADAVAGLVKDPTAGRRLRNRDELVPRSLGVGVTASQSG